MKYLNIVLLSLLLTACASSRVTTERNYSGFLDDYSVLEEVEVDTGGVGLIWLAPDLADKGYTKAILEPTVIYPEPKRDSDEAKAFIVEITRYMDAAIQSAVGQSVIITDNPGPNTVRVRFALTGVLVWVGATTAAGSRTQVVEVFFEAEMSDSLTGEILGRSVRKGIGDSLENRSETLTVDKVYPQLDLWAEDATNIADRLKAN
jgi:hypothetical protein